MDRLKQDLLFFKSELERETDPFQRNLVLRQIARVEQQILRLMIQERERIDQQNRNMERFLEIIRKREQEKNKNS